MSATLRLFSDVILDQLHDPHGKTFASKRLQHIVDFNVSEAFGFVGKLKLHSLAWLDSLGTFVHNQPWQLTRVELSLPNAASGGYMITLRCWFTASSEPVVHAWLSASELRERRLTGTSNHAMGLLHSVNPATPMCLASCGVLGSSAGIYPIRRVGRSRQ